MVAVGGSPLGKKAGTQAAAQPARQASKPTSRFMPCPAAAFVPGHAAIAVMVMRGPRAFWLECPVCLSQLIIAPKILKTPDLPGMEFGMTREQAFSQGLTFLL